MPQHRRRGEAQRLPINLMHVDIPDDLAVIGVITDIVRAPNLDSWLAGGADKFDGGMVISTRDPGRGYGAPPDVT